MPAGDRQTRPAADGRTVPEQGLFVFDAFGTLFDTGSMADRLGARFGSDGPIIAATWRATQLRYTWLRSLMDAWQPFERVTRDALGYAVRASGRPVEPADERVLDDIAAGYAALPAFPEVGQVLGELGDRGASLAVLSNGSSAMLRSLVEAAGLADAFDALLSVDAVRVYKPHPAVYQLVVDRFIITPPEVRFVSGNSWDCAGASRFGFDVTSIDRGGTPFDELEERPDRRGPDLSIVLEIP